MTLTDPDPNPTPTALPYRYDGGLDAWEVDAQWLALHGLPPDGRFTTEDLLSRVDADDRASTRAWLEQHVAEPGTSSHTYRMRVGHRSGRRVRLVAHTVGDASAHRPCRVDGFLLDITGDISRWQSEAVTASAAYRATIEQAKGALMLAFCVDEETAFRMLAGYSQRRNAKLRDVAAFITDAIGDPHLAHPDHPVESLVDVVTLLHDDRTHLRSAPVGAHVPGA
jgi:hypothetical protein